MKGGGGVESDGGWFASGGLDGSFIGKLEREISILSGRVASVKRPGDRTKRPPPRSLSHKK